MICLRREAAGRRAPVAVAAAAFCFCWLYAALRRPRRRHRLLMRCL